MKTLLLGLWMVGCTGQVVAPPTKVEAVETCVAATKDQADAGPPDPFAAACHTEETPSGNLFCCPVTAE